MGCTSGPTGAGATAAAIRASPVNAYRWPDDDLNIIVLSNTAGPVGEVRDLLRETLTG